MKKGMMEIVQCPNVEGADPAELESMGRDKCYICDDPVLRPTSVQKRTKAFCSECYQKYLAAIRKKGGEVTSTASSKK